jgi:hypothetical protein
MNIIADNHQITLINEPAYSENSTDNKRSYERVFCRSKEPHYSAHGVIAGELESPESSVVLLGVGGATGVHKHSLACNESVCFVAAGDAVFALKIPSLELKWCDKVDHQTCFGVYWIEAEDCLITWGEVAISRYTADGEKVWSASGADIFKGFEYKGNHISVTDFGERRYTIKIKTGKIQNLRTE